MAITNYDKYLPVAQSKGKLATFQDYSAKTKAAAEVIPYGVAVQLGEDKETVIVCNGGTPTGIALAQEIHDWVNDAKDKNYQTNMPVAVVRKGVVWIEVVEDVSIGDKANVDTTTGDFIPAGTETAESVEFPSAVFKTNTIAGELAQLEINLP